MTTPLVIEDRIQRVHRGSLGIELRQPVVHGPRRPVVRPATVAVQLALAHSWEAALARGDYESRGVLAATLKLTRARVCQLLDFTLLAPDIQEQVLRLEAIDGQEPIGGHTLRRVLRAGTWRNQRQVWREVLARGDRRRAVVRCGWVEPPQA